MTERIIRPAGMTLARAMEIAEAAQVARGGVFPETPADERICELHAAGLSDQQIADEMGRGYDGVKKRRRQLGLSPNGGEPMTDAERDEVIRDQWVYKTDEEIAPLVGRGDSWIRKRRQHLGLRRPRNQFDSTTGKAASLLAA